MVEWIKKSIGELFSISGGHSASRAQLSDNGYFYLHYGDIHASTKTYIDTAEDKAVIPRLNVPLNKVSAGSLLQDGDVVFVDASEDDIGASRHIVVRNTGEVPFIAGLHTIVAKPVSNETDKAYREYCFQTADVIRQFKHYAVGTKVTGVNKTTIKKICILFPKSLLEQQAIAAALSDVDGYITALERLISKKRNIKQGAMQELLRPKNGWVEKTLGEIGRICMCKRIMQYETSTDGDVPFYKIGTFGGQPDAFISNSKYLEYRSKYSFPEVGDVLISAAGTIGRTVVYTGEPAYYQDSNIVWLSVDRTKVLNKYLYYYYQTFPWNVTEGSTIARLYNGIISSTIIYLPALIEQTQIATILSDMDAEIEALTVKLNKANLIKKGMMEQLLTGKIQLAETETASVAKVDENSEKGYKDGYRDAVILVALVKKFGTEEYPFTAFDCQKFPYLFHRHVEGNVKGYKKFEAGPYNPGLKYRTARPIALGKNYIREHTGKYKGFVVSDKADEALGYFAKWYGDEPLKWLEDRFRYLPKRKDELELLTTTDKAMVELRSENKPVTTQSVKDIIKMSSTWKDKLKRPIFSDANITRAIKWSIELFGQEVTGNA
jgi:type I restriction enzyme S subunit